MRAGGAPSRSVADRIGDRVSLLAPGAALPGLLVLGTALLLIGGSVHFGITTRDGTIVGLKPGSVGEDLDLGNGSPGVSLWAHIPSLAPGDRIRAWTIGDPADGEYEAIAIMSRQGTWQAPWWDDYAAPFTPKTWGLQQAMAWGFEPLGAVLCLAGLLALRRRVTGPASLPTTVAVAGVILMTLPLALLPPNLFGHEFVNWTAWRFAAGVLGCILALSGGITARRRLAVHIAPSSVARPEDIEAQVHEIPATSPGAGYAHAALGLGVVFLVVIAALIVLVIVVIVAMSMSGIQ